MRAAGRRTIGATTLAAAAILGLAPAAHASLGYRKAITVPAASVRGGADLASFPLLVSLSGDPDLRGVTYGGRVQSPDAGDVQFRAANGTTILDHEVESYDPATGSLVAWVRVPALSASAATVLYLYYGDPFLPCALANPAGVWSGSGYEAVYHLRNGVESGPLAQDAVVYGTTDAAGNIGRGRSLDPAALEYLETASSALRTAPSFTLSAWFKAGDTTALRHILWQGAGRGNGWGNPADTANNQEMHLSLGDVPGGTGTLSFFLGNNDRASDPGVISFASPFTDTTSWHHVAVVVQGLATAPSAQLFLDGVAVGSGTGTLAATARGNWDTPLRIGRPGIAARTFDGSVDEVRVALSARTAGWIATEHANQNAPGSFYAVGAEAAVGSVASGGCAAAGAPGRDGALTVLGTQVLNRATALALDAPRGSTTLSVTSAAALAPLAAGDLLLVVQMKGAVVDENPVSSRFGTVTSLGGAGRYELATVASVAGNVITLRCVRGLRQAYTAAGGVQVVRVPQYSTLTIAGKVTALPWDGATGGVVALRAETVVFQAGGSVDATALGFRGGAFETGNGTLRSDYGYVAAVDGARKGEGIASATLTYAYGRGAPANGGGGGDGHNSGGGGGANAAAGPAWCIGTTQADPDPARCGQGVPDAGFGAWGLDPTLLGTDASAGGGRGGYTWSAGLEDPDVTPPGDALWLGDQRREVGGSGGHPVPGDPASRVFFGGGGGAGHANDSATGPGGRGGGIVFVFTRSLSGAGTIAADGADGGSTSGENRDGASGAGGGGSIVIRASGRVDDVSVQANGGRGGDHFVSGTFPAHAYGPGGGGGGGLVAISSPVIGVAPAAAGGASGTSGATTMAAFPPNGATGGGAGLVSTSDTAFAIPGDCLSASALGSGCPSGSFPTGVNLVANPVFASGATGFTSGVPNAGDGVKPYDTSFSIQTGRACFDFGGAAPCPNVLDQRPFPGDPALAMAAANGWLYANGNDTGAPYMAWQQTVAVSPGTTYLFFFHASNVFAPGESAPDVPVLQAFRDGATAPAFLPRGTQLGPDFGVPYESVAAGDAWTRFQTSFTTGPAQTSTVLSIWDAATGSFGDDVALTGIGLQACAVPTAVRLASFEARAGDGLVALAWATASELDNVGFHLYRSASPNGPWQRLDAALIPGLGSSPTGAAYSWVDGARTNGVTYHYRLEDVDTHGVATAHGPVSATPRAGLPTPVTAPGPSAAPAPPAGPGTAPVASSTRWTFGAPLDSGLVVIERGPSHVVLELRTGGFWAVPHPDGSVRLEAPGLEVEGPPGGPALPLFRSWVDAVAGRVARVGAVRARDLVEIALRPEATPERVIAAEANGSLRAGWRRHAETTAFLLPSPTGHARILESGFLGGAKKARVEIAPLQWDPTRQAVVLARRVRVRIDFDRRDGNERATGRGHGLRRPTVPAPPFPASGGGPVLARLEVGGPGLYAVRFEDALPPFSPPVALSDLRLSRRGEPVAYRVEPAGLAFGPGRSLYFLSEGSALNREGPAVYELARGRGGRVMETLPSPPSGPALGHAWTTSTFEKNVTYQPGLLDAPDLWLWDAVVAAQAKSFPFALGPVVSGLPARLVVDLQGASDQADVELDHHLVFRVNGRTVGEASWDGKAPYRATLDVPAGVLVPGEGRLEIESVADTGASAPLVFLDRFSLTWPRALAADGGLFDAAFDRTGAALVAGLPAATVVVEANGPRWVTGATPAPAGLAFTAREGGRYLAVPSSSVLRPVVRRAFATTLRASGNRADWLLVAPREMLDAARPLVARRRAQGLRVRAVAVEDVYDEFGYGEHSAAAVRAFLVHAYHEWQQPGPRFVVLLGDATTDPKDYIGRGRQDRVPPLVVRTPYLWTASDPGYAAVNGDDGLPDLAIGRLPAGTVEEAQALVAKVLEFERAGRGVQGLHVLVADNADAGGDFEAQAEEVAASLLAGRPVERIYLGRLGAATKPAILDAFDAGASVVSYVGHGAAATWASENVFNSFDVPALRPQPEQPVVLTLNCLNGYFVAPAYDALAEALVKAPGRGAIAAVSPSGLSLDAPAHRLHLALVRQLLAPANRTLGDAFLAAQAEYAEAGGPTDVLAVYHLFGDPALRLR